MMVTGDETVPCVPAARRDSVVNLRYACVTWPNTEAWIAAIANQFAVVAAERR
jgi:hypothetical protein